MSTSQKEIEVILTRQLASYLAMPIFLVDPAGTLIYYNEPAEKILGERFEETGPMPASVWAAIFQPVDKDGRPLAPEELPLTVALNENRPAHRSFTIRGLDGVLRCIEVTALPLVGMEGRDLGALAVFWEMDTQ